MPSELRKFLTVGAFVISATSSARAQEKAIPQNEPITKIVVHAEQEYDVRREETITKIVINQQELAKFGDATVMDALKRQPGVTIGGGSGRGGAEIRMRGLGAGYVQILIDGQPAPAGFSLTSLSPTQVDRIEILRAATAELSTRSIAGTINVILKTKITASREAKVAAEGSDSQRSGYLTFQTAAKLNNFAYMFNGVAQAGTNEQDSTEIQSGMTSDGKRYTWRFVRYVRPESKSLSLTPRLIWTLPDGGMLLSQTVWTIGRIDSGATNIWSATTGAPPLHISEPDRVHIESNIFRSDLNYAKKMSGGKLDARVGVSSSTSNTDIRQQGYAVGGALALDRQAKAHNHETGVSSSGKFAKSFVTDHMVAMGWDGGSNRINATSDQNDKVLPGYASWNFDERYTASLSRLALFAQDEMALRKNWSVYLGARWEMINTSILGENFSEIANHSRVFSPIAQSLWKFSDGKSQVRIALTRTYKAQAITSLIPRGFISARNSAVAPDYRGNPHLKPELATGIDTAYEYFLGKGAVISISAYSRRISDYTVSDIVFDGERWVQMPVNSGLARSRGVEFDAKLPLQLLSKSAPAIDVRANLSRNWSAVESINTGNNRISSQVPLSGNFGLDYRANAAWTMGANYSFKQGGKAQASDAISRYQSDKRDLDAYLLWVASPKYQLRFSVINALGQTSDTETIYRNGALETRSHISTPSARLWRILLEAKL